VSFAMLRNAVFANAGKLEAAGRSLCIERPEKLFSKAANTSHSRCPVFLFHRGIFSQPPVQFLRAEIV